MILEPDDEITLYEAREVPEVETLLNVAFRVSQWVNEWHENDDGEIVVPNLPLPKRLIAELDKALEPFVPDVDD